MTEIIGLVTQEYALMASDRRLTLGEGPKQGELVDDDTCKLVNLCNVCAIAYTDIGAASEVLASLRFLFVAFLKTSWFIFLIQNSESCRRI